MKNKLGQDKKGNGLYLSRKEIVTLIFIPTILILIIIFLGNKIIIFEYNRILLMENDKLLQLNYYLNSALLQVYATLFGFLLVGLGFSVYRNARRLMDVAGYQMQTVGDIFIDKGDMLIIFFTSILTIIGFIISVFTITQYTYKILIFLISFEIFYAIIVSLFVGYIFIIFINFFLVLQESIYKSS
jgi:hypothetical protein